jgi:GT2 family glycosyltransferase
VLLHRLSLVRWTGLFARAYRRYRRETFDPTRTRRVEFLLGAAVLAPREVFFDAGQWDEGFVFGVEDLELSARIGRRHELVYHPEVEIVHYGRASSRQRIGYASTHHAAGLVRYLRKAGYRRPAVGLYKLAVTLDAPVQLLGLSLQYLWRRLRGRPTAGKSLLAARGVGHFLTRGLPSFWRA